MRILCVAALLTLGIAGTLMAQQTPGPHLLIPGQKSRFGGLSHIEIDLGQRNSLLIGFDRYAQVLARQNLDSVLHLFMADYQKVADTARNPTSATYALYQLAPADRALDLRSAPQPTASYRIRRNNPPLAVKTRQDTVQIIWAANRPNASSIPGLFPAAYSVYLFVNSIDDIAGFAERGGLNGKLKTALQAVEAYKGHDLTNPKMSFDMILDQDEKAQFIGPGLARAPFISLHAGVGVGLIRNQWVPSLNAGVQFIPSRLRNVAYGVSYTSNFFFSQSAADGQFQSLRNDFLNVGVAFYRANKDGRTPPFSRQLASFYVGVPVHRRGPYFERDAIRLSGTVYQNGLFKVQPEFYMNGFFKNVYPGVRVVVGL